MVEDLIIIPDNNPYGFFIECDFEYPAEIKEKTENFPLCPYPDQSRSRVFLRLYE